MRKISEKTIITALVNIYCVGYPGKCLKSLTKPERVYVLDELVNRGLVTENIHITREGINKIKNEKLLDLCQY